MNLPQPVALSPHRIDPRTLPGHVHLKVASLENQLLFYQNVLRLELNWREGVSAGLGVNGRDLVRLKQIPNGKRYRGVTGIYHFAILFPNRRELARAVRVGQVEGGASHTSLEPFRDGRAVADVGGHFAVCVQDDGDERIGAVHFADERAADGLCRASAGGEEQAGEKDHENELQSTFHVMPPILIKLEQFYLFLVRILVTYKYWSFPIFSCIIVS
jgi:hypothetical protein